VTTKVKIQTMSILLQEEIYMLVINLINLVKMLKLSLMIQLDRDLHQKTQKKHAISNHWKDHKIVGVQGLHLKILFKIHKRHKQVYRITKKE